MNEDDLEFYKGIVLILNNLVEERTKFLLYVSSTNPEVGFPLTESIARLDAIETLKEEGKIPPFFEEL
jgi:hypothetical protein